MMSVVPARNFDFDDAYEASSPKVNPSKKSKIGITTRMNVTGMTGANGLASTGINFAGGVTTATVASSGGAREKNQSKMRKMINLSPNRTF